MRIVFDTNVLIAAFVSRGLCHTLFEHCSIKHDIVTSDFILNEFREKLVTRFKQSAETANEARVLLRSQLIRVSPVGLPVPVSRDPDDDMVIATAIAGACEFIVTGDKDLLVLELYGQIRILSPRDFVDAEMAGGAQF